jgi:serine/threonine protein kinase
METGCPTTTNIERYERLEKLGEGTYGVVYKAKDKQTGEVCEITDSSLRLKRSDLRRKKMECLQQLSERFLC